MYFYLQKLLLNYPGLFLAIFCIITICIPTILFPIWLLAFIIFLFLFKESKTLVVVVLVLSAMLYIPADIQDFKRETLRGDLRFKPLNCSSKRSFFSTTHYIKAEILSFDNKTDLQGKTCIIQSSQNPYKIEGGVWEINGSMQFDGSKIYFQPFKNTSFIKVVDQFEFYSLVISIKKWLLRTIKVNIRSSRAKALIEGLLTGSCQNHLIAYEFQMMGLSHLLAISGLHFSTIALFLVFMLSKALGQKNLSLVQLVFFWIYWSVIGDAISVFRAYVMFFLLILSQFLSRKIDSLNRLLWAFVVILSINPESVYSIGFQFSFAATFALITFSNPIEEYLCYEDASKIEKPLISILAANSAVHAFVIPISLWHFGKFPLLSMYINLVYPPLICVLLIMILLSLMGSLLFSIGHIGWSIVEVYAENILDIVWAVPFELGGLHIEYQNKYILFCLIIGLCIYGIALRVKRVSTARESLWETIV